MPDEQMLAQATKAVAFALCQARDNGITGEWHLGDVETVDGGTVMIEVNGIGFALLVEFA